MIARWAFVNLLICCEASGSVTPRLRPHRDVVTSQGVVRGYFTPRPPHYVYLGLPYGRPPTHRNRFKASEAVAPWDGIFEATHRVMCPQPNGHGDENCLVLNIFMPQNATSSSVIVHFHSGGFQRGWGSFNPPIRLLNEGFVIVTFNYRLGALGFLCLNNPEAPGNAGLKDQLILLYWVQKNISKFGGNPLDVTLFGSEFGAAAVEFLLLSKTTKRLFHKVIMESESALSPLSTVYNPVKVALEAAKNMGYNGSENIEQLTTFFQKVPIKKLTNIYGLFLPCVERDLYHSSGFLNDPLEKLLKGNYPHMPILMMYRDKEILPDTVLHRLKTAVDNGEDIMPNNLEFENGMTKYKVSEFIKKIYFSKDVDGTIPHEMYMQYVHDLYSVYPIVKSAALHTKSSFQPIYLMEFSYKSNDKHNDGIPDIYNYVYAKNLNVKDDIAADKITSLLRNFIKFGDPTPLSTYLLPVIWEPVTMPLETTSIRSVSCLRFSNTLTMAEPSSLPRLIVWDYFYKTYYKLH